MATTVRTSHSRGSSITKLECEVNPHFTFPALAEPTPPPSSTGSFQFPPVDESNAVLRRSSAPLDSIMPLETAYSRPRSKSSDALKQVCETGLPSPVSPNNTGRAAGPPTPYYPGGGRAGGRVLAAGVSPTVLNATVTLGPVPEGKGLQHKRMASELLEVPTLEPQEEETPALPSPQKSAPLPAGQSNRPRRGHAHRRSGAISSGDVWSLMNQSAPSLPIPNSNSSRDSASNSSLQPPNAEASPILSQSAPVSPGLKDLPVIPSPTTPRPGSDSEAMPRQVRVSFIDRVEIIPRPMSSGTESSTRSTVRGHGGRDSMGSLASFASPHASIDATVRTSSPTRRHNRTRSNSQTMLQPTAALRAITDRDRPSTAGAVLLSSPECKDGMEQDADNASSVKRPATASPSLDNSSELSPTKLSPTKKVHKKAKSDFSALMSLRDGPGTDSPRLTSSADGSDCASPKKQKKGKKQIKDWAGNILGKGKRRRTKRGTKSKKRSPTPPLPHPALLPQKESEWVTAAWNESYVMMPVDHSPTLDVDSIAVFGVTEEKSPVIDLDAALGPFKTSAVSTSTDRRRRMHSANNRPGYFHRRSESMPEMQLFALEEDELTTMDDVFEEDEEDEDESSEDSDESSEDEEEGQMNGGDGLGIGLKEEIPLKGWHGRTMNWGTNDSKNTTLMVDDLVSPATASPSRSITSIPEEVPEEVSEPPPTLKRKGAPAGIIMPAAPISAHSSSSTVTSSSQLNLNAPLDSPATFVTAASNLNTPIQPDFPSEDESFNPYNDYLGEPGPEMRMSVDDIPSLTSSSSTMTMSIAYSGMPPTPGTGEMLPLKEKDKKEKGRRWSRVWGFWRTK